LDEIRTVSDRVTVIRRGKSIDTVTIEGSTNADLAEMMVGRHVSFKTVKTAVGSSKIKISAPRYKVLRISTRCWAPTEMSAILASTSTLCWLKLLQLLKTSF